MMIYVYAGCSSSTPPQSNPKQPKSAGTFNYQLNVANIRALLTLSGQYVLWLRMLGDTAWYAQPLTYWTVGSNSLDFLGTISLAHAPDSIETVFVSIEPPTVAASPTSILMTGTFDSTGDSASMSATNVGGAGDYSKAKASVIFTTKSPDTNQAKSEFFLMDFIRGVPTASVSNLPIPPHGWAYGLWVLDSNFYPLHKFFYGTFTNPDSSDFNPTSTDYPFPGGYNRRPLNDPGARLEVTLEPSFAVRGNHPAGPSPLTLLWVRLRQFIDYNDTLPLANAWASSAPHGILKIFK
ncbi:MAG TPA: hypothetical protein VFD13_01390 [Candidatus Kapabacteria bacterium]|nr:hypothetical protein [Candidatus Kapabacteria bacterium]